MQTNKRKQAPTTVSQPTNSKQSIAVFNWLIRTDESGFLATANGSARSLTVVPMS